MSEQCPALADPGILRRRAGHYATVFVVAGSVGVAARPWGPSFARVHALWADVTSRPVRSG